MPLSAGQASVWVCSYGITIALMHLFAAQSRCVAVQVKEESQRLLVSAYIVSHSVHVHIGGYDCGWLWLCLVEILYVTKVHSWFLVVILFYISILLTFSSFVELVFIT